jgi:hypothetical protein
MLSGAAKVVIKEIDLSTRIAAFQGVYAAVVVKAKKGEVFKPFLCTSENIFLKRFAPKEVVEVGYDNSYFSALAYLERGNKLWVSRAANGAEYSGLKLQTAASVNANAGIPLSPVVTDPSALAFAGDELLFVHAIDGGAFGKDIAIKCLNTTDADNAFYLEVYSTGNTVTPLERFLCSRVKSQKDGFGRNIYVEEVVKSSLYIRVIDNVVVTDTTLPKQQTTALFMTAGSDGAAVTDTQLVSALAEFNKREQYPLTLVMDGGHTSPAFQIAVDTLCKTRMDCVGILCTPYADEIATTKMTDLVAYRSTDLNLNSSYSALYTPHLKIQDKYNDRQIWVAPDGYVAGSISFSADQYEIWYPPAGYKRGVLNVLDVAATFEEGELDTLQNAQINPIRKTFGRGIVIWGQRTLTTRPSSLDRLNARLALIVIEPALKTFLEDYQFDLVTENDLVIIKEKIENYLETIKTRRGVFDYLVVADSSINTPETLDRNELNVDVYLKLSKSAEFITVRVAIVPLSLSFEEARTII